MPYIEAITVAGKTVEIEKYFTFQVKPKGMKRDGKQEESKDAQKGLNTRYAERTLRRLINANFQGGDYHLILGYKRGKDDPYRTADEMKADVQLFFRKLRKEYKKLGKELKYIQVAEVGERGARHHHVVLNKIDTDILQKCWPFGRMQIYPLDDSGQYAELAAYFIKYTDKYMNTDKATQSKRWNCSRNLVRPVTKKRVISGSNVFRTEPKEKKGYYLDKDSVYKGISEFTGYAYFTYTLIELESKRLRI